MTTATCTGSTSTTGHDDTRGTGARIAGTRVTTSARDLRRWWRDRRDALIAVGPEPAGPWSRSDRPDRDRIRVRADLRLAPRG